MKVKVKGMHRFFVSYPSDMKFCMEVEQKLNKVIFYLINDLVTTAGPAVYI